MLAQDLPCFSGAQLAVDITLRSKHTLKRPTRQGVNIPRDCNVRPMQTGRACHRGRWSEEAVQIVRMLAFAKAQEVPSNVQFLVALMWERRWTCMLATTCAVSFAASLFAPAGVSWCQTGGGPPPLSELVELEGRWWFL